MAKARAQTILRLVDIGKGLIQNATTKLIDVLVSSDVGNLVAYGSDNGLFVGSVAAQPITIGMSTQPAFDIFYASDSVAMYEDHGLASAPVTYSLDAGLASAVDLPIKSSNL